MRSSSHLVLSLILLFLLSPALTAADSPSTPAYLPGFESAACPFESPFISLISPESMGFECGYVTVPERHANPTGPTIRLPVAILRATGPDPQSDPLFLAQGGPGGDAFSLFSLTMPDSILREDRDLVIFNQRGTQYTEPDLTCTEAQEALPELLPLTVEEADQRTKTAYKACYQRLQDSGVDLSAYNSLENAADVEAIRAALGYDEFNFYGVSYGTLLGLHLMNTQPENLRSVVLDAVVPTQINFIPLVPQNTDRIFSELIKSCAADAACRETYPNLEERLFALVDKLNEEPVFIPLTDPETGQTTATRIDGDGLLGILFQIFYLPDAFAVFPKVVTDLEAGDYSFIKDIGALLIFDRSVSDGMYFSVICAEDADFDPEQTPLEGVRPQIARNAIRDLRNSYIEMCQLWHVDQLPPSVDDPVSSDIPALLLSGQFDPITPPANAEAAAETLSNSYSFIDPVGSHGAFSSNNCVDNIVRDFLNDPFSPPNGSCLNNQTPADFVPPGVLRVDLLSRINRLDGWAVTWTLLAGLFLLGVLSAFAIYPLIILIRLISPKDKPASLRGLRWGSRLLVLLFGLIAVIFVVGLNYFVFQALDKEAYLIVSSISGSAAPLFVLPFILALLALLILAAWFLLWLKRAGSIWGRLYYTFLTVCVVGYVAMLAATGMFGVLI